MHVERRRADALARRTLGATRALVVALTTAGATLASRVVSACPNCAVGREARSDVWNDDFGLKLLVSVLPFLVVAAVALFAEAYLQRGERDDREEAR